ncbi:hypothetical protein K437DRAFT_100834 [Tilletiaria anomala UBC 951]|uniref:Uncharacterized protein n=1 Tax=Tilletiaria anomala (strain ATCC 24038 / CBS 436.72 / UBC 951) TaxID=1037660 RepID=A0A066W077_TILAU|nr:uncharacterized protein K437DRAFT_100834 [Tilletiaria anomala UBC 951]KDN47156.1 hypothetical protein K437DRAFT_100834 [Tilletiaria anomala UBC 951]
MIHSSFARSCRAPRGSSRVKDRLDVASWSSGRRGPKGSTQPTALPKIGFRAAERTWTPSHMYK